MILEIPKNAETILHILEKAGYEAYVVGGCVRDSILGRSPDDWDITTSAKPEQVKALFHRTVDTGLQHGTVTVLMEKEGYEVTTYRVDGEYEDGRHPKEVTFTASLKEDLKRRDFTINAMAYNPSSGLVDLFGGLEDIERKIIRCVGDPLERFTEDALRIMRAVRFSAQLGFAIEEETRKALKVLAPNLKHVSAERIQVELVKLLMSPHPDYLRVAYEAGITAEFLPEFDACMTTSQNTPHHCYTVGEHILHSLCHVRADKVLRITMLLHDIGKPVVRKTDENGRDHFKMHGIPSFICIPPIYIWNMPKRWLNWRKPAYGPKMPLMTQTMLLPILKTEPPDVSAGTSPLLMPGKKWRRRVWEPLRFTMCLLTSIWQEAVITGI